MGFPADASSTIFLPWVPEAFLARFPVAAYLRRPGLRPISPDASEKKTSGTQDAIFQIIAELPCALRPKATGAEHYGKQIW